MPRTARASVAGLWYHVLNRGNRREAVFHKPGDYDAFVQAMTDGGSQVPVDLLGYYLMPNHFHLLVRPHGDGDLERLRHLVCRGRPYGGESWTRETAIRLGLESGLRPRGRPRKEQAY